MKLLPMPTPIDAEEVNWLLVVLFGA